MALTQVPANMVDTSTQNIVLQQQRTITATTSSGTTVIPWDNTIPQITEGVQFLSVTITPKSVTSKLVIEVTANIASSVANWITGALFQDSTANALAASNIYQDAAAESRQLVLTYVMTSGTTSATTFTFRAGGTVAGTTTLNGVSGSQYLGGVMTSAIIVTEYAS